MDFVANIKRARHYLKKLKNALEGRCVPKIRVPPHLEEWMEVQIVMTSATIMHNEAGYDFANNRSSAAITALEDSRDAYRIIMESPVAQEKFTISNTAVLRVNLGFALHTLGRLNEAKALYKEAIGMIPELEAIVQARITDTHNKGSRTANKDKGSGTGNKGEGTEVALLKLDHGKHSLLTPLWCNWAGLYMQLYETPHWLTGSVSDKDLKYQFASSLLVNSIEPPPPPHCGIKGAVKQSHFQDLKSDT